MSDLFDLGSSGSLGSSNSLGSGSSLPITVIFPLDKISLRAIAESRDFAIDCKDDIALYVSEFLTSSISKVGGTALVEVTNEVCSCFWVPPYSYDEEDRKMVLYIAHMLMTGLLDDPTDVIANLAYSGRGAVFARSLVIINTSGLNKYVATRDATLLAMAAPLSLDIWMALGLIVISNEDWELARIVLDHILLLDSDNLMGLKYMAILCTAHEPKKAVNYAERLFGVLARTGVPPDAHSRVTYGFALQAARMKKESAHQFEVVCGLGVPRMTRKQWLDWGFALNAEKLVDVLLDPSVHQVGETKDLGNG